MGTSSAMSTSNSYVKYNITINQNSQSVENNTSNVTVSVYFYRTNSGYQTYGTGTVYCKINGTTYSASVSPSQKITSSGITLFSTNLNIGHNSDGTKTLETSAWISIDAPLSSNDQGYSQTLTTIPRASSVSGGSGNIGSATTISVNRMSSSFTHRIYWSYGSSGWQTIATNVGTSYTWTIPTSFYSLIPNSNSGTGSIKCETYNGSTYIGYKTTSFTFNITNSNPTFSSSQLTYQDTNSSIVAITSNNQHIVRNKSTLQAVFTAATARNSATMSKYQITFNGATQEKTSASTIAYGTVDSSSNLTLTVKAIDSRGNNTTISKTVTFLDWVLPTAVITANRQNNFETTTYLQADTTISSVNSKNSLQELKYRNKKTSDASYSAYTNLTSGVQSTISIDNNYAWDFQVVVTDKFGSTTYNLTVAKGKPLMFFDTELLSVGVNKLPTSTGALEIDGDLTLNGGAVCSNTTLYNNASGTQSTITLSDSAANYDYIEIYYYCDYQVDTMSKIYNPNGKSALLSENGFWGGGSKMYARSVEVAISGTSVTWESGTYGTAQIASSGNVIYSDNPLYITRIVGFKY